ncbi:hypothetical protein FACS1894107_12820 [Planctomycetales bacterium]|nr:hypothetical protein FACS1894107_12820 [Planctomycetales bacterium]GHV18700.1 hypothetical protein AGMMS49959_01180 [Planctomycetales bacterium]
MDLLHNETFTTINPAVIDEANKIAKATLTGGFQSWEKAFSRGVLFQFDETTYEAPATALANETETLVVTSVGWDGERAGKFYVVVPATAAKGAIAFFLAVALGAPADLEGTQLDTDGLDAYSELAGALVQQGAQALRGEMSGKIEWTIEKNQIAANPAALAAVTGEADLLCASGMLTIEGVAPVKVYLLMTVSCTGLDAGLPETAAEKADATPEPPKFMHRNEKLAWKLKLPVIVVLATTKKRVENVEEIAPGTIIEFRKFAGEFLDVNAGNTRIAAGEVVIVNQHFGVQLRKIEAQVPFVGALK